jgi:hypothetical protein
MNREQKAKFAGMIAMVILVTIAMANMPSIMRQTVKEIAEAKVIYTDGVVVDKYESRGFLWQREYSLKIKYGKDHIEIYDCPKDTYLLVDKGQALKVILSEYSYKISNIAWEEDAFNRYIANRDTIIYNE